MTKKHFKAIAELLRIRRLRAQNDHEFGGPDYGVQPPRKRGSPHGRPGARKRSTPEGCWTMGYALAVQPEATSQGFPGSGGSSMRWRAAPARSAFRAVGAFGGRVTKPVTCLHAGRLTDSPPSLRPAEKLIC